MDTETQIKELLFEQMKRLVEKAQKEEDTETLCRIIRHICMIASSIRDVDLFLKHHSQ